VDTHDLAQDLRRLVAGEAVRMPRYNFKLGMREHGDVIQLHPGQVIILEGIHGLNPELLPDFPIQQTFRIYASALTQLNLDRHNRISTTDTRLVRRIVRDARERGYTARETIQRWDRTSEKNDTYSSRKRRHHVQFA
jgi:uridine kinase